MASTQEFECLVLGDEPAGLWLLQRLDEIYRHAGEKPYFGWIQFEPNKAPVAVPKSLADKYSLKTGPSWRPQVITKKATFEWESKTIEERFPAVKLDSLGRVPKDPQNSQNPLRYAEKLLHAHPELLTIGTAFWKYFGRTTQLTPQSLVSNAFHFQNVTWWDPKASIPSSVAAIDSTLKGRGIEKIYFSKKGMISLQLEDQTTLLTRHLILNLDLFKIPPLLETLPELAASMEFEFDRDSGTALYPLQLQLPKAAVSSWASPINFLLDNTLLPNLDEEIWPFVCESTSDESSTLTLWVSWANGVDLEGLLARFQQGFERLCWLFPFLSTQCQSLSLPLNADGLSQRSRVRIIKELEQGARDYFTHTRTHARTRRENVNFLSPSLHAQLPYPFGPLLEAESLSREIAGRKRLRSEKQALKPKPSARA